MKNFLLLLTVLSATSCAQSTYRYGDDYGDDYRDRGGYAHYEHRYGTDSYDDGYDDYDDDYYGDYDDDYDGSGYADAFSDIDFNLSLNWNAFPDRYGIAYGAAINGPYRYPRVGFYYRHNWYPSAWWGSYSAFDPWYSDYYYRYRGSYFSLSFNFYDFDDDWDDPWFDAGWGYALGYNWFRPAYGWNPWRRHHNRWYSPWYDPYYTPGFGRHYGHRYGRHGSSQWVVGPHFTPIYRGSYDNYRNHRRTDHIDTRSEAARLAAQRPYRHYTGRSHGRVTGNTYRNSRYTRHDNPRNVATRQYKRPYERQRSTRSTHRYDRVPASNQPFTANRGTVSRRHNGHSGTAISSNRLSTNRHGNRLGHDSATRYNHTSGYRQPAHKPRATTTARAKPLPRHSNRPVNRTRTETHRRAAGSEPRRQQNVARNKPLITHINRYRSPTRQSPQQRSNNRYRPQKAPAHRPTAVRHSAYRPTQQRAPVQPRRLAPRPASQRPAPVNQQHRQRTMSPLNLRQRNMNQRANGGFFRSAHKPALRPTRQAPANHTSTHKKKAGTSAREHLKERSRYY